MLSLSTITMLLKPKSFHQNVVYLFLHHSQGLGSCGTSHMKAILNAVPSIASRDGGLSELIVDNVNGWLFGEDIRELIEISSQEAMEINERGYSELKEN